MPEYPTIDLIALAFAVQRINGRMIKQDEAGLYDPATQTQQITRSNKTIMFKHLDGSSPVTVLEQDHENAREAVELLVEWRTMKTLQDQHLSPFMHSLVDIAKTETTRRVGLVAYVPEMSTQITLKQATEQKMQTLTYASQHIGAVGQRLEFSIKGVSSKFVQRFGCYFVFGYTPDDNCVSFFTRHEDLTKSGDYTGRVKRHTMDTYRNNVKVTEFNFVKAVDSTAQLS